MILRAVFILLFLSSVHFVHSKNDVIPQLLKKYEHLSDDEMDERVTVLNDIAWEYAYEKPDSALHFAHLAKKMSEKLSNNISPNIKANTYGTLGIIYDITGNKKSALQNYLKSLEILKELKDTAGIATAANNIGALFHSLGDHQKALDYFNTSYENEMALKDTINAMGSLINLAVCYKNLGNIEQSKKILFQSLKYCHVYKDTVRYGQIYSNLGAVYLQKNELDSAHFYFEEGLKYNNFSGNFYNVAIAHENLARIGLLNKELKKSKENIIKALHKAEEGNYYTLLLNSYETAFEIYLYERNIDSAYYFKKQFETIKDSVQNTEQKKIIDELETKYKITEIEKKVLKKDLEIAESQNTNLTYLIVIIVSAVTLFIMILFAIMKNNSNKKLKEKNDIIEKALDEKEILMREIHHRVKNNIQAIKSILNIQKRKSKQPEVVESLNLTLNRVNTMSLIHQKLYKQDELSNISPTIYFKELIKEATKIFGFKDEELKIEFDIGEVTLDIGDLFNLGLIINELVTNACKYGVSEDGVLRLFFQLKTENDNLIFKLQDEGVGDKENKKSFGSTLIQVLIQKMNGKIHYLSEQGWKVELIVPYDKTEK